MVKINLGAITGINPDPRILLHPLIPDQLSGVAPRNVLGSDWWNEYRRSIYAESKYLCAACGRTPDEHPLRGYHCHEIYSYDYQQYTAKFEGAVALGESCHMFIHAGFFVAKLIHGEIKSKIYKESTEYCLKVLKKAGIKIPLAKYEHIVRSAMFFGNKKWIDDIEVDVNTKKEPAFPEAEWRLEIYGKLYSKQDILQQGAK